MKQGVRHQHWLLAAARTAYPDVKIPASLQLSDKTIDAWQQVAQLFNISSEQLAKAVADHCDMESARLDESNLDAAVIPEKTCRQLNVIPLREADNALVFGICEPEKTSTLESQLVFATGRNIRFEIIAADELDTRLTGFFSQLQKQNVVANIINLDQQPLQQDEKGQQNVRLAQAILRTAIDKGASDIHIQPFVGGGAIRFRIDGVLQRIATIPLTTLENLARYYMIHGNMDSSKTMIAQDGRMRLMHAHKEYDVRLSMLPSFGGMRIVARILDQNRIFSIRNSGFSPLDSHALHRLTAYPSGIVLLTGPTGSGKTSTLYSMLTELNQVNRNIITIEDPVEYVLHGVSQVQVNNKQGLTFADSIRAILRQDPDVVLVGEIRDTETAEIAVQAALTGHLVLSTLHTNDALTVIPRLLNLGLDPSILADTLVGVVSQRLIRKLCEHCCTPLSASLNMADEMFYQISDEKPGRQAVGCEHCQYIGYKGRIPVVERFEVNSELRALLLSEQSDVDTMKQALGKQYRSMINNTSEWIVSGKTTVMEAHRVMGMRFWNELAQLHEKPVSDVHLDTLQLESQNKRPQIVLLSTDSTLAIHLNNAVAYEIVPVENEDCLEQQLNENQLVKGIVIDSRNYKQVPEQWLGQLRERFAWTGIAVVFLVDANNTTLIELLQLHKATIVLGFPIDPSDFGRKIRHSLQTV